MQQQMIANAYPGILDGIIPHLQFADAMTFSQPLFDCELLVNVFKTGTWTRDQMNAVSGMYWGYCVVQRRALPGTARRQLRRSRGRRGQQGPGAQGGRASAARTRTTWSTRSASTRRPAFARSPWDNVGIQYGLRRLNDGKITMDQFIDINTRIGGHDANGKIVPQRQVGDPEALRIAYRPVASTKRRAAIAAIPQVDTAPTSTAIRSAAATPTSTSMTRSTPRSCRPACRSTSAPPGDYLRWLRLVRTTPRRRGSPLNVAYLDALTGIDKWIMAIKADKSTKTPTEKVVANKPADLVNACYAAKEGFRC